MDRRMVAALAVCGLGGCGVLDCTVVETTAEYHATSIAAVDGHVVVAMDIGSVARLGAPNEAPPDELPGIRNVTLVGGTSTALAYGTNEDGFVDARVVSGMRPIGDPISLPAGGDAVAAAFDGTAYEIVWVAGGHLQAIAIREDGSADPTVDLGVAVSSPTVRIDAQHFDSGRVAVEIASFSDPRAAGTVRVAFLTGGALVNPVVDVPVAAASTMCARSYAGAAVLPEPVTEVPLLRVFACVVDGTTISRAVHVHPDRTPVEVPVRLRFDAILAVADHELAVVTTGPGIELFALTDASADPNAEPYASRIFAGPSASMCGEPSCAPHWTAAGATYFQAIDQFQLTSETGGVTVQAFDGRGSTTELGVVAIDETGETSIPCPRE